MRSLGHSVHAHVLRVCSPCDASCLGVQPTRACEKKGESRDAKAIAQALGGTLEEACKGQISFGDREAVHKWLMRNSHLVPETCTGLCR